MLFGRRTTFLGFLQVVASRMRKNLCRTFLAPHREDIPRPDTETVLIETLTSCP